MGAHSTLSVKKLKAASIIGPLLQLSPSQALDAFFKAMLPKQLPSDLDSMTSRLIQMVTMKTIMSGEDLFVEGSLAEDLIYIVNGQAVLTRCQRADEGCKLPTHHLNNEKG